MTSAEEIQIPPGGKGSSSAVEDNRTNIDAFLRQPLHFAFKLLAHVNRQRIER
jgi:hypothetical protein